MPVAVQSSAPIAGGFSRPPMSLLSPQPVDFEETWALLESSLLTILQDLGNGFPNDLWMTLYSGVYKLCTKPMDPQHSRLYARLKEMLEEYVSGVIAGLQAFTDQTSHSSGDLLLRYKDAFQNYSLGMKYGSELFVYLDRHWIGANHCEEGRSPKEGVYRVYEMALIVWKERVFDVLKVRLRKNIIRVVNSARDRNLGDLDDDGVVQAVLQTYETLGFEKRDRSHLFQKELEDWLIADTSKYFSVRGSALLQYMTVPQYLVEVERYLAQESSRCASYVGMYSARRILVAAQGALIGMHAARLVDEARSMLAAVPEKREDLHRLYVLISYLDEAETPGAPGMGGGGAPNVAMDGLQEVVREYIQQQGLNVIKDLQSQGTVETCDDDISVVPTAPATGVGSDDVVNAMLGVYEHYRGVVTDCFNDSMGYKNVLDEACKAFVNSVPRAPEWLARYAHCLLDKGFKESRLDEDARGTALDRTGFLFAYISDKDIFHKYYAKLLSKRIIQLTSVSDEAEERMLANMRRISGFEYTSKLQRMFVDKALSRDLHTGYVDWQERRARKRALLLGDRDSIFTFTDDEERASQMMEEMSVSGGGNTQEGLSPPMSPMYFSPKGLSPRMNILPSFAWGKQMLRHLKRRHPAANVRVSTPRTGSISGASPRRVTGDGKDGDEEGFFFSAAAGGQLLPTFEAFTFVLTAGCWPLQSVTSTFKPPGPIEDYVASFLEYYNEAHNGRKLEWLYHLGHGEMVARCFDKEYRINSSTFQMGILHLFNDEETLTVEQLGEGIKINTVEIVRHLFPLIKAGLLVANAPNLKSCDDLRPEMGVSVNLNFSSKRSKIKINIVDHSRQPAKDQGPPPELIQDRKMSTQACICRVMKIRKEMTHRALIKDVADQLQHLFEPDIPFIKKNIEELIEKDYLARVEGKDAYRYCA